MHHRVHGSFALVLLTALLVTLGAPACSSSSGNSPSATSVALRGGYYAKGSGPYAWLAFVGDDEAVLFSSAASCRGTNPAASCYQTGPYAFDDETGTLAVSDFRTGQTITLQVDVLSLAAPESEQLVTLGAGLVTGSNGNLAMPSGAIASPAGSLQQDASDLSITSPTGATQQLTQGSSQLAMTCKQLVACACALIIAITPLEQVGGVNPEEPVRIEQPEPQCAKQEQG
jgi:hypothetical protein